MSLDVLLVDDSAVVRKVLLRALRQAEFPVGSVHEAGDGVEALAQLHAHHVDLILCDINMPNMDGLEFLRHLRAEPVLKSLPVVLVSRESSQAVVLEALRLGASGYVRIPFTPEQIKSKLLSVISTQENPAAN